jgi:D-proline reductase (dithiol) PrdB
MVTDKHVDGFRFAGPAARILQQVIPKEPQYDWIPWTPLTKPLSACRFSLLTTAGVSLRTDTPFDMERERQDPTWGDPSFRRIPSSATANDVDINHLHIVTTHAEQDLNVVLPLQRFQELKQSGEIGSLAPTCYSIMGFNTDPTELVCDTAPKIAEAMLDEGVEAVLLVPV